MKLQLLALLAMAACAAARTATRQPAVSAHITSLNDKDAKRKAMEHPAFANAGRQAGVEIWRIEDFEPVLVPQKDAGKFYKGDSYIVLKTTSDKRKNLSWDIHYWLGSATSQDEAGAAAILTVGLDDKFGGAAVQHRETQGHESSQFLSLFQPAIRYLDGGHASGFSHVTTNAGAERRLFQVKGKRNVRVRQVDPLISSMNKGDVFILDKDQDILVYVGEKAKNVEKLKATSVANQIKDQDHNGRGRVEIIDQYSSEADVQRFFTSLGSGSRDTVPEDAAGGDDQAFERNEEQTVTLSEISDKTGKLVVSPLPRPYKQEQLNPQEAYILDTVSGSIYVWVGKQSTAREKTEAMNKAQQYLTAKSYPSWVHVSKIPQGTEPAAFKQYFSTWKDVNMKHSRLVRSASDEELYSSDAETADNRARHISKTGAARAFMPDDGEGSYVVYRIKNNLDLHKLYDSEAPGSDPGRRAGEFYQGDSYLVEYQGSEGAVRYFWIGKDSALAGRIGDLMNADTFEHHHIDSTPIVVPQGEEPKHLLKIFKGLLVTLLGGASSTWKTNQKNTYAEDGVRLFKIFGTTAGVDLRAVQVPEAASSLRSDDVFLLETPAQAYLWQGEGSSAVERASAPGFASKILGKEADITIISQGDEPEDFWNHLPGSRSPRPAGAWRGRLGRRAGPLRVYEATSTNGVLAFEELSDFKQSDMMSDDVFLLDAGEMLFVWIGADVPSKSINDICLAYLRRLGPAGEAKLVLHVKQGREPRALTDLLPQWDSALSMKRNEQLDNLDKTNAIESNDI